MDINNILYYLYLMSNKYNFLYNIEKETIIENLEEEVLDNLYFLKSRLPTKLDLDNYIKKNKDNKIYKFIIKYGDKSIDKIKKSISKIEYKIPLYDVYSDNIYIINKNNVFFRVIYNFYRFPDKELINQIKNKKKSIIIKIKNNKYEKDVKILKERNIKKFDLTLEFLNYFDLDILYNTYMRVFYLFSEEYGFNISTCQRPSFLPHFKHIKPYYSQKEIINLALNMNLIINDNLDKNLKKDYNNQLIELCNKVKINDISSKILLNHQEYMIKENKVGLIQYYSLHGSYFINQYLRGFTNYNYKNEYLESIIKSMWNLVYNSPSFNQNYTLYRFINNDDYLQSLKINDIYIEPGFMSTTRDPFYRPDIYNFGFILMKINIPKDTVGVGLCIETLSHFPLEQEIIFPPLTMLKLIKKDEKCEYYHINKNFVSQIKTKYEFEYIGKKEISFISKPIYPNNNNVLKLLDLNLKKFNTLEEKIDNFINKYLNPMYQCKIEIGDIIFDIITEFYDSSGAYKNFYAMEVKKGFSLYSVYNDFMLFFIEIGKYNNINIMHVDYNRKYSIVNRKDIISDEDFIIFLSSLSYCFDINKVIIYSEYISCDKIKPKSNTELYFYGGTYSLDIYNYLVNNNKRYENTKILNIELTPKYSYYMLDKLKHTDVYKILRKDDNDEIYQIYDKIYKDVGKNNVKDFIIWIIENKCYLIDTLINKLIRLYKYNNPFNEDYYILDPNTFLYNRGFIATYPKYIVDFEFNLKRNVNSIPINGYKYRNEI